jgi:hypothetical protein
MIKLLSESTRPFVGGHVYLSSACNLQEATPGYRSKEHHVGSDQIIHEGQTRPGTVTSLNKQREIGMLFTVKITI